MLPGYGPAELAADFRAMCGAAMLRLWKRSQSAAQYVSNVLDSGNQRLRPLLATAAAASPGFSAPPSPAAAPPKDPAEAFWLSGHEVRDLLTIKLALPAEPDAAASAATRRVPGGQPAFGAGVKRKVVGTAAYGGGKRRRSDEELPSDLTEKNQKYLSQMLLFISLGEDCDLLGSGGPSSLAGSPEEMNGTAKQDSPAQAPLGADAGGAVAAAIPAVKREDADVSVGLGATAGEPDAAKASKRASRDRWTQVPSCKKALQYCEYHGMACTPQIAQACSSFAYPWRQRSSAATLTVCLGSMC